MKCIIFDCDGVLVDSEIITTKHFIKHLQNIGYQISIEDAIKRFTGISDKAVYEEISKESGIIFTPEQIRHIQEQVHDALHAELPAITGIAELLASLEKNGTKMCVASSGTLDKIYKSLDVTGLGKYFSNQNIFSVQHVQKGKPAPDLFLFAARQMGYDAQHCIVIEDSLAGVEAAIAANMRVIGFLGGSHAHYDWYKLKMSAYNIPIAQNSIELSKMLAEQNEKIEIKFLTECKEQIPNQVFMFELYKVKSFSENSTQGNLAGVVLNAQFLSEADMQNISAQMGASETAFVLPSSSADIRLRWFTPNTEVGMCVHATMAALGVLRMRNELSSDTIKVETKNTELLCQFRGKNVFLRVPGYHQVSHKLNILKNLPLFPLNIAQVIGIPGVVKIFDDYELVIEVDSFDCLQNLKPEQGSYTEICTALGVTGISIFTRETMDTQNQIHTREFAPLYGYLEDPLCGMAAGAIFTHIKANETVRVEQGHFCGTSGVIIVEPETIDTVWIGGAYCIIQQDIHASQSC